MNILLPLHTDGRWIRNSLGGIVLLRGIVKGGFEDEETGWWNPYGGGLSSGFKIWNPDAVKTNLDYMRRWGFNNLVLLDSVEWWHYNTPDPANTINHKDMIKNILTWANERGLYVILEQSRPLHWTEGESGKTALPYPPYRLDPPIPDWRLPEYEAVLPNEQAYIDNRVDIANELKGFPNVLVTMWGEPCLGWLDDPAVVANYWSVIQRAVDGMRAVGFNQPVILSMNYDISKSPNWYNSLQWAVDCPVNSTNLVYGVQTYPWDSWASSVRPDWWTDEEIRRLMTERFMYGNALNELPILILESGLNVWRTGADYEHCKSAFTSFLNLWNEWELGYNLWWWRQGTAYDIFTGDYYTFEPNETGQIFIDYVKAGEPPTPIPPLALIGLALGIPTALLLWLLLKK